MFTGIVTDVGTVRACRPDPGGMRIEIETAYADLALGESIAVGGACLTVADAGDGWFAVQAVTTTRDRTVLGDLVAGARVNLERALRVGDRLGGHWVQGHVDGVGTVVTVTDRDDARLLEIAIPLEVWQTSVLHGSITIDGVSLTVNRLGEPDRIEVSLIPFTLAHTTLGTLEPGHRVHVEGDVLAGIVQRLLGSGGLAGPSNRSSE